MDNPFDTLGLEPSFELDLELLELRQRELSRALHPDRYVGHGASERRQALSRAMDVNHACRTLRDPLSRADALLGLLGASASAGGAERHTDPMLLSDMLEQREALDQVRQTGDRQALHGLKTKMLERQQALFEALGEAFEPLLADHAQARASSNGQPANGQTSVGQPSTGEERASLAPAPDEMHLARVRPLLTELRYVRRFLEEVGLFEDEVL